MNKISKFSLCALILGIMYILKANAHNIIDKMSEKWIRFTQEYFQSLSALTGAELMKVKYNFHSYTFFIL